MIIDLTLRKSFKKTLDAWKRTISSTIAALQIPHNGARWEAVVCTRQLVEPQAIFSPVPQLFASMVSASSRAVRTDTMSSTFIACARKINSFLVGLIDSSL